MPAQAQRTKLDDYLPVDEQIAKFRELHPTARLVTQRLDVEPLAFRAEVYLDGNDSGIPNAVGHADVNGGMGNRGKSPTEATETAAIGRALAHLGVGRSVEPSEKAERTHLAVVQENTFPDSQTGVNRGAPAGLTISAAIKAGPQARDENDLITEAQRALLKRAANTDHGFVDYQSECRRVFGCEVDQLSKSAASALINHLKAGAPDKWA